MVDQANEDKTKPSAILPLKKDSPSAPPASLRPAALTRPSREPLSISNAGNISSPEGKKLLVGREIELSGNISTCDRLVVEGRVEAELQDCREIEISGTGTFKGSASIEIAEISGRFDGTLIARDTLVIRSSGRVTGTVRYRRLEIERGGEVVGDIGLVDGSADG